MLIAVGSVLPFAFLWFMRFVVHSAAPMGSVAHAQVHVDSLLVSALEGLLSPQHTESQCPLTPNRLTRGC